MTDPQPPKIELSAEERGYLWFMPQVVGGKVVPEEVQQRFEDLGLVARLPDGRRWPTVLGDKVRLGSA